MDLIESQDWAVNAHFRYLAQQHPEIRRCTEAAFDISSPIAVGVLIVLAMLLFLLRGRRQAAVVAGVSFAAAMILIESARYLAPLPRPQDAQQYVNPGPMLGSYPSSGALLFTLGITMLGFALAGFLPRWWQRLAYGLIAGIITLWVCLSQFLLCIHFLTDVIGGLAGAAIIIWIAYRFIQFAPPGGDEVAGSVQS